MCEHGTDTLVLVKVAAHLSSTGADKWRFFGIDSCIAPIVDALQKGGVDMLGSCCGHGKGPGRIDLRDGRVLMICADADEFERRAVPPRTEGQRDTREEQP